MDELYYVIRISEGGKEKLVAKAPTLDQAENTRLFNAWKWPQYGYVVRKEWNGWKKK